MQTFLNIFMYFSGGALTGFLLIKLQAIRHKREREEWKAIIIERISRYDSRIGVSETELMNLAARVTCAENNIAHMTKKLKHLGGLLR